MNRLTRILAAAALGACAHVAAAADSPHNIILFVPDGLRAPLVDAATAPAMARLRDEGVNFHNSHALFPTFTTANASAFATGHLLGDTGDWANTIYTRLPFQGSVTPYLENDAVLRELNMHLGGSYLHETTIFAAAAASQRISTASIGKLGPAAIFDPAALRGSDTLVIDDATGQPGKGLQISEAWQKAIEAAKIKQVNAPSRGDNSRAGTFVANLAQQQYFLEMTLKVVLPRFKELGRPFLLVYWSRDPDGTQHTQGDGGINGPTSLTALRAADGSLAAIEQTLKLLGLYDSTNIIVAADHGFSTIAKDSENGARDLPVGFVALDLATALRKNDASLQLFDPDDDSKRIDLATGHTSLANGVIGADAKLPQVVVTASGGSDLIYLPVLGALGALDDTEKVPASERRRIRELGRRVVQILLDKDYTSGLFIDEQKLGKIDGALSLGDVGLMGEAITPRPAIVVSFRSYVGKPCDRAETSLCAREISDTTYLDGGGMHGSFSRADTWNFMAARGPDFRVKHVDGLPASNADIGMTMARLLGLQLVPKGKLMGRVLDESLRGHEDAPLPRVDQRTLESRPSSNGLKTVLQMQSVSGYSYYDVAGFAGRTVGLE